MPRWIDPPLERPRIHYDLSGSICKKTSNCRTMTQNIITLDLAVADGGDELQRGGIWTNTAFRGQRPTWESHFGQVAAFERKSSGVNSGARRTEYSAREAFRRFSNHSGMVGPPAAYTRGEARAVSVLLCVFLKAVPHNPASVVCGDSHCL